ncbi:MAG: glycine zipper 2TM domain-containing protein [Candidatus Sumerlaeia bacterium]
MRIRTTAAIFIILGLISLAACSSMHSSLPQPDTLDCPKPIMSNRGKYMSPYTSDGVLTEWVDKVIYRRMGAGLGAAVGAWAGSEIAQEDRELEGAIIGAIAGYQLGADLALKVAGGWDYIRKTSDISFNSLDNMAVWLYATHSSHRHYIDALNATFEIYPELKSRYRGAILNAVVQ